MASFKKEYPYRTVSSLVRHDVCNVDNKSLAEDQKRYEEKLYNLMLDELLKNPDAFSA